MKQKQKKMKVFAEPEVLRRFTTEQLAALEARVSGDISAEEMRDLKSGAARAYIAVERTDQLLRDLKALRLARGLTQDDVDQRSGIGRANVSRLENMHLENPSLDTIMRYAQAIGAELWLAVKPEKPAA